MPGSPTHLPAFGLYCQPGIMNLETLTLIRSTLPLLRTMETRRWVDFWSTHLMVSFKTGCRHIIRSQVLQRLSSIYSSRHLVKAVPTSVSSKEGRRNHAIHFNNSSAVFDMLSGPAFRMWKWN